MSNSNNGIVKTLNEHDFINEFKAYNRMDNFSIKGLRILFESLEQMAIDCQMNIEMDVIALCCEYNEDTIDDIIANYSIDVSDCIDFDDTLETVETYLCDNTFVCGRCEDAALTHNGGNTYFVYQAF